MTNLTLNKNKPQLGSHARKFHYIVSMFTKIKRAMFTAEQAVNTHVQRMLSIRKASKDAHNVRTNAEDDTGQKPLSRMVDRLRIEHAGFCLD